VNHAKEIADATCEIFSSMIMLEVTAKEATQRTNPHFENSITGMVGLAGTSRGNLLIHLPASVATAVTTAFLGMDVDSIDDDVCDAIGELANMLAGAVKTALDPGGSDIKLSMPSTVYGESYSLDCHDSGTNVLVPFDLDGGEFSVELQLADG
jgi:chemotaxis protein CheX